MRNWKRFLTATLAAAMVVSATAFTASAAKFTDVDMEDETLYKAVDLLNYVGVIKGKSETEFGTDELVTREQMAAFIYRMMKKGKSLENSTNTTNFTDLEDPTFFGMISWASTKGIIKGTSETTFDPKGSITLQDAYVMITRALGYENEETLPYPYGFIEVAEQSGVELDKGIDSTVAHEDALTRGDVAILLYNMFFAETGIPETKQVEKLLGEGTDAATYVLQTKTEYPIFCEKYFDVIKAQYQVVATPHYALDDYEETLDFGYDAMYFQLDKENTDDTTDLPDSFYWDFKELNLDGKSDDYFWGNFEMFVTVDDDENEIDTILYAESLMNKKTVDKIEFKKVSTTTKKSYMSEGDTDSEKVLSGEIVVDGKSAYFYNAPYSYLKPSYADSNKEHQYDQRNEENLQFIKREAVNLDDETFKFENLGGIEVDDKEATVHTNAATALIEKMAQAYVGGLFSATFYDVDGDNRYEYVEYMPYRFAIVDTDDDYEFSEDYIEMESGKPIVYTNEANIELPEGVKELKDDDFVIGYFDKDCNYIKIAAVVEPIEGKVKDISKSAKTITLSNDEKVSVNKGWRLVANYEPLSYIVGAEYNLEDADDNFVEFTGGEQDLLSAEMYDKKDGKYYVYGGAVLFTDDIDTSKKLSKDVLIITEDEDNEWFHDGDFNKKTGKREHYAYAWINGELKWITVETDIDVTDVKPKISETVAGTYLDRISQYTVDGNGVYTVTPLMGAEDKDGESYDLPTDVEDVIEDKDDEERQAYGYCATAELTKSIGKRFFLDSDEYGKITVTLTKDTVIVIKNTDEDGDVKFETFNYNTLTDSIKTTLNKVQFVIGEDTGYSNRANLIFLFAECDELELDNPVSAKSDRIIKLMDPKLDADDNYVYNYTVLNPYTGATETAYGTKTQSTSFDSKLTYGMIAEITTGGKIEDKADSTISKYIDINSAETWWIVEYDEENDILEVCQPGLDFVQDTYKIYVDDTPVTKIGDTGRSLASDDLIKWNNMSTVALDKLGTKDKSLLAACTNYFKDEKAKQETKYADYIEAYFDIEWEDDDNRSETDKDTKANGEANYIVVLVHNISSSDIAKYNEDVAAKMPEVK